MSRAVSALAASMRAWASAAACWATWSFSRAPLYCSASALIFSPFWSIWSCRAFAWACLSSIGDACAGPAPKGTISAVAAITAAPRTALRPLRLALLMWSAIPAKCGTGWNGEALVFEAGSAVYPGRTAPW